ncbi:hypothetical protein B0H12DRAFT_444659 [Mycena haematopus]|nr:hypothetical protein B0H12DRAFT_444659 [Mycena haematopus]
MKPSPTLHPVPLRPSLTQPPLTKRLKKSKTEESPVTQIALPASGIVIKLSDDADGNDRKCQNKSALAPSSSYPEIIKKYQNPKPERRFMDCVSVPHAVAQASAAPFKTPLVDQQPAASSLGDSTTPGRFKRLRSPSPHIEGSGLSASPLVKADDAHDSMPISLRRSSLGLYSPSPTLQPISRAQGPPAKRFRKSKPEDVKNDTQRNDLTHTPEGKLDETDLPQVRLAAGVDNNNDEMRLAIREHPPRIPASTIGNTQAELDIRALIPLMERTGVNLPLFLEALQNLADKLGHPFNVFLAAVAFTHAVSRTWIVTRNKRDLGHFDLVTNWRVHPRSGKDISIALFATWLKGFIRKDAPTADEELPLHFVAVLTIHPQRGGIPRAIAIFDANVRRRDRRLHTLSEITNKNHLVKLLQHNETNRTRPHYFINEEQAEHNSGGDCLALTLEWLVKIIVCGLQVTRDAAGNVSQIQGFRSLKALK